MRPLTVLVLAVTTAAALLAQGTTLPPSDAVRGQALFDGKGGCLGCHRVLDHGSRFGPDLTDIGARAGSSRGRIGRGGPAAATLEPAAPVSPPAALERSLLDPAAEILPQNRTVRLVTRGGQSITARVLNQDTFSLQLIDTKEQVLSVPKSDLREFAYIKNSPMPSYREKFTPQELADVIAYLVTLKGINP